MKRRALTTAVIAGVAGVAGIANISSAVNLNPDGLGEVLIYPFYTVNGGNDTLLSIVNTTDTVKAVKVRFLESKNSREVLDFNLYMSPFDVWVAAVTSVDDTGAARVIVPDGEDSCTVPSIPAGGQPFSNQLLTERLGGSGPFADNSLSRTREGYIEMIEMGVVDESADGTATGFESAAIHVGGVPQNCARLVAAWSQGGIWRDVDEDIDVTAPAGGLFGGASIISVNEGYQVSYNAEAIESFFDPANGSSSTPASSRETLHSNPGDTFPTLLAADTTGLTGDPLTIRTFVFDSGDVVQSDWDPTRAGGVGAADPVSALFMRDRIFNEYAIDSSLNAATEWVITFPTKRFYVDPAIASVFAVNPFTFQFVEVDARGACEEISLSFFDREEGTPAGEGVNFSPAPVGSVPELCQESQVVTFGQSDVGIDTGVPSAILASPNSQNIAVDSAGFENGWAIIDFVNTVNPNPHFIESADINAATGNGDVYLGLPAAGFSIQVVQNGTLTGSDGGNLLSNYAGLFNHRASRDITGS